MVNKLYLNKVDLNNSVASTSPSSSGDDDNDNVDVGDNDCDVILALKRLFQEDNTSPFSRKMNLMMQEEAATSTSSTTTDQVITIIVPIFTIDNFFYITLFYIWHDVIYRSRTTTELNQFPNSTSTTFFCVICSNSSTRCRCRRFFLHH